MPLCHNDVSTTSSVAAWRRGMLGVIEAMSVEKPENGWFIPNCGTDGASIFLSSGDGSVKELAERNRKNVRIPLFANPDAKENVLQVSKRYQRWVTYS